MNSNQFEKQLAEEKAAKTSEEIRAFAEESNIPLLSPDELDKVNGGLYLDDQWIIKCCWQCGSKNIEFYKFDTGLYDMGVRCKDCGFTME